MTLDSFILAAHAFSTLAMVGLIWFVQVVHYPLFAAVPAEAFRAYESSHQRRTTWVVAPLMLVELVTAASIAAGFVAGVPNGLSYVGVGLVVAVWGVTFLVSVPLHAKLESGKDEAVIRRLVATNWIRTVLWTARGAVAVLVLPGV
jgi:phage terminase large subunit-like protein